MSWVSERLSEIRACLASVRAWRAPWIAQGWHWLITPRDCTAWWAKITTLPRTYGGLFVALVILLLLLPLWRWYEVEKEGDKGAVTYPHASLINPILGGLGALFLIYAAIRQARTASEQAETARKQAQIAADRHAAQTNADLQRRTTETFSKAVEQLGSEKMEVRVGGIYTLERLASEALTTPQAADATGGESTTFVSDLYWTVMETLTAFVRERARWEEPEPSAPEMAAPGQQRPTPATDIAAVLQVLHRRPNTGREREKRLGWRFDLSMTDLRGAILDRAHLEGANLRGAHLERAYLIVAHLEGANLIGAHLAGADLRGTHLESAFLSEAYLGGADLGAAQLEGAFLNEAYLAGATLVGAHLEGADLYGAHLERAVLWGADLAGANLRGAHLQGAALTGAHLEDATLSGAHLERALLIEAHLERADLSGAIGDARTQLPDGVARPAGWPPYTP